MSNNGYYQLDQDYVRIAFNTMTQFHDAVKWCGEQGWDDYVLGGRSIYFNNEQHATMCALRWA